jgi:hypothetical protein
VFLRQSDVAVRAGRGDELTTQGFECEGGSPALDDIAIAPDEPLPMPHGAVGSGHGPVDGSRRSAVLCIRAHEPGGGGERRGGECFLTRDWN